METNLSDTIAESNTVESVSFGPFKFDRQGLLLSTNGTPIPVPPKALLVLRCLVDRPGKVVPKTELMDLVWGDTTVTDNSLTEAIRVLRQAIGDDPRRPSYIETAHRRGYRFIGELTSEPAAVDDPAAASLGSPHVGPQPGVEPASMRHRRSALVMAIFATVILLVAITFRGRLLEIVLDTPSPVHLFFRPDPADRIEFHSRRSPLAISPDGSRIAYIGQKEGVSRLYLRPLAQRRAAVLPDTEGASDPFFSPAGDWIAYYHQPSQTLRKVSVAGGAPIELTDVRQFNGGTWGPDGSIVFGMREGLWSIGSDGEDLTEIITASAAQGEKEFQHPHFLPGGGAVLFAVLTNEASSVDDADIAVLSLETGDYEVLLNGGTAPRYAASGHIVYARDGALLAAEFDLQSHEVTSAPFVALADVATFKEDGSPQFALSAGGTLVYLRGGAMSERELVWVDRQGVASPMSARKDGFITPSVSPDGRYLAVTGGWSNHALWIYDIQRDDFTRLTNGWDDHLAVWTYDGSRIAFQSNREQTPNIFWTQADGAGPVEPLWLSDHPLIPTSWSSATNTLAFAEVHPETGADIWFLSPGDPPVAEPFLRTKFNEREAEFSPDGRFIAYASDESGQFEIYVRTVAPPARRWTISRNGGRVPRWSASGDEIFFWNLETELMAFRVDADFTADPELLFDGAPLGLVAPFAYNTHPSGGFVVSRSGQPEDAPGVDVSLNWVEGLQNPATAASYRSPR